MHFLDPINHAIVLKILQNQKKYRAEKYVRVYLLGIS